MRALTQSRMCLQLMGFTGPILQRSRVACNINLPVGVVIPILCSRKNPVDFKDFVAQGFEEALEFLIRISKNLNA